MELRRFGPKPADHPTTGQPCKICNKPMEEGEYTTLLPIGPAEDDEEAQERAAAGLPHNSLAIEVHYDCGHILLAMKTEQPWLDLARSDGWSASINPLIFGGWKLNLFTPEQRHGVSFFVLDGPAGSAGQLAAIATELLLAGKPFPIDYFKTLDEKRAITALFPEHEEAEQQNDRWYRFIIDGQIWPANFNR